MIRMRQGAWLPSPRNGFVWAEEAVVDAVEAEVQQRVATAITEMVNRLAGQSVETEVGTCVMWRVLLAELPSLPS